MDKGTKITIVGGVPYPIGGVTNYVLKVAGNISEVDEVLDLYPSSQKQFNLKAKIRVRPKNIFLSYFWLVFFSFRKKLFYFNFSTEKSLFLLLILPKKKQSYWYLTLHHGSLKCSPFVMIFIKKMIFSKIDKVGYLSDDQYDFFANFMSAEKLFKIGSHLPISNHATTSTASDVIELINGRKRENGYEKVFLCSGYPTKIYQHNWVIEHAEKSRGRYLYIFCIYGPDSDGIKRSLINRINSLDNTLLFEGLSALDFQEVIKVSDVYLRPNSVDSYGVAVAEAIEAGVKVVASDVCARAEGCILFNSSSKSDFENKILDALTSLPTQPGLFSTANENLSKLERFLFIEQI